MKTILSKMENVLPNWCWRSMNELSGKKYQNSRRVIVVKKVLEVVDDYNFISLEDWIL